MDIAFALKLCNEALLLILILSGPALLASLGIGLLISIFQATTQIQEQTLTFVPKIVLTFLTIMVLGPWLLTQLVVFTQRIYHLIPRVIGV
ncbi:MAG: flagellar biosynthesis protein FliQ [Candidatus Eisenbacteria bacterium]